jgi:hypothetical protein
MEGEGRKEDEEGPQGLIKLTAEGGPTNALHGSVTGMMP